MKKFFIVATAALLCVCVAGPSMAKIQMGGMVTLDTYYLNIDEQFASGGVVPGAIAPNQSLGITQMELSAPLNRVNMKYTSDDGMIGGFLELRGGGARAANNAILNYAWIDWRFNPNVYLRIGRQTQAFSVSAPQQRIGFHSRGGLHCLLLFFGNVHGASSRDSLRLYWKFNDMIRMELQAMDPDSDPAGIAAGNGVNTTGLPAGVVPANVTEEQQIPRFDLALPISVGGWRVEPNFTWTNSNFANIPAGSDDNFNAYGAGVSFSGGFGPVVVGGEFTWGRNLGTANYAGAGSHPVDPSPNIWSPAAYVDANGNIRLEDTDGYGWWFQLGFKVGPATIYGIVGNQKTENDGNPAIASVSAGGTDTGEWDVDKWAYGVSVPISVAKGFTIRPEFMYYDYDGDAKVFGVTGTDLGKQWTLGIQWQLAF
jgi:hypothetical protein